MAGIRSFNRLQKSTPLHISDVPSMPTQHDWPCTRFVSGSVWVRIPPSALSWTWYAAVHESRGFARALGSNTKADVVENVVRDFD
jgi:hypothetical protein